MRARTPSDGLRGLTQETRPSRLRRRPVAFCCGKRANSFTAYEFWQPRLLLVLAAKARDGFRGDVDRAREWHRRVGFADFFCEYAEVHVAQAGAAVLFGQRCAQPAELGHALPEFAVETAAGIEQLTCAGYRAFVVKEAARLLTQQLLLF